MPTGCITDRCVIWTAQSTLTWRRHDVPESLVRVHRPALPDSSEMIVGILEWTWRCSSCPPCIVLIIRSSVLAFSWLEILERTRFYRSWIFQSIWWHNHVWTWHILNDNVTREHFRLVDTFRGHLLQGKALLVVPFRPFIIVVICYPAFILTVCPSLSFSGTCSFSNCTK